MALAENGRGIIQVAASDGEIKAIVGWFKGNIPPKELGAVDPLRPRVFVFDGKQEAHAPSLTEVPKVEDINEYVSRIVEAEIAAQSPIPTIRRPLNVRRIASLSQLF